MGLQETCSCEQHKFRYVFAGTCYVYGGQVLNQPKNFLNFNNKKNYHLLLWRQLSGAGPNKTKRFVCKIKPVLNNYQTGS